MLYMYYAWVQSYKKVYLHNRSQHVVRAYVEVGLLGFALLDENDLA